MIQIDRKTIAEYYYYFVFILWFGTEIIIGSTIKTFLGIAVSDINQVMAPVILVLLMVHLIFLQEYSKKEIMVIFFTTLPILLGTYNSEYNILLSMWLFVLSAKYANFNEIVKISYFVLLISMFIIFLLFSLGIIKEVVMYRGGIVRHSFGFAHPNFLGMRIFQLVLARAYLRKNRIGIQDYILIGISIWFVYKFPNCKTAYVTLTCFLVFLVIHKFAEYFRDGKKIYYIFLGIVLFLSNCISVILSIFSFKNSIVFSKIDSIMSYRFSACHKVVMAYGISMFGKKVDLLRYSFGHLIRRYYMDTAYVTLIVRYGVVVYLIFSFIYLANAYNGYKKNNIMLVTILSVYALYGIMEINFFSLSYNTFLIALAGFFYGTEISGEQSIEYGNEMWEE